MLKFYHCKHCGNVVVYMFESGVQVVCCGEKMQALEAGVVDAAKEKHVPVLDVKGGKVTVKIGSVPHPMEEKHYIPFVVLETSAGYQVRHLKPGDAPEGRLRAFLLDRPVCLRRGVWHATLTLSEAAVRLIAENLEVTGVGVDLSEPVTASLG